MRFIADSRERLDRFLARMLPEHSRSRIAQHIDAGAAKVEGARAARSRILLPGQQVEVEPIPERPPQALTPADLPLETLYEDEWLMVIDKPAGLTTHPARSERSATLVEALLSRGGPLSGAAGAFRPGIVHRLDKNTSGAMLVAKTDSVHAALQKAIQMKRVRRQYLAWVRGWPAEDRFSIRSHIGRHPTNRVRMAVLTVHAPGARPAVTHCQVMRRFSIEHLRASELLIELETGRTHQIRVHLASVGLPVLGDPVYGVSCQNLNRQALHSFRIEFDHPVLNERMMFEAPLPRDLITAYGTQT
jgi:23S rRNA pseudouridine1911/1915/1917 synthase